MDDAVAGIVGQSQVFRRLVETLRRAAPTLATVLLQGESGTGKGLLARAVHGWSGRPRDRFVAVNCGAVPDNLLASELFGHERGAFTGASAQRAGKFEAADGGTLFLDEIGEISPAMQVALLGVLQERAITRLGSNGAVPVDVRVIAATNRDLRAEVAARRFREDLYYRLNVISVRVPALRERREDVPALAEHVLQRRRGALGRSDVLAIAPEVLQALARHDWPGNVRELENVIERALTLASGRSIDRLELDGEASGAPPRRETATRASIEVDPATPLEELRRRAVEQVEACYLELLLRRCGGDVNRASGEARVSRRSFYEKLKRYGLRAGSFRAAPPAVPDGGAGRARIAFPTGAYPC